MPSSAELTPNVRTIVFDATVDGKRYGPWFDCIVGVERRETTAARPAGARRGVRNWPLRQQPVCKPVYQNPL